MAPLEPKKGNPLWLHLQISTFYFIRIGISVSLNIYKIKILTAGNTAPLPKQITSLHAPG